MFTRLDHLVVAAATLDQGAAWCEATLGVVPGAGGKHALFGTHNRLLKIASRAYARAYLELIALDPDAAPEGRRAGPRWFGLDNPALQVAVQQQPRLVHWVAATDDIDAGLLALHNHGLDAGQTLAASRDTPQGPLRWRIGVRDDGARLLSGTLPTLIQWDGPHPADAMPDSGVHLVAMRLVHPQVDTLRSALAAVGVKGLIDVHSGAANLVAELSTPCGTVRLESLGH